MARIKDPTLIPPPPAPVDEYAQLKPEDAYRKQLYDVLRQKLAEQKREQDPAYRRWINERDQDQVVAANKTALASGLMKAAAQTGTLYGKTADASPVEEFGKQATGNNAVFYDAMRRREDTQKGSDAADLFKAEVNADLTRAGLGIRFLGQQGENDNAKKKLSIDEENAELRKKVAEQDAALKARDTDSKIKYREKVGDAATTRATTAKKVADDKIDKPPGDKPMTEDERKRGMSARIALEELERLEAMEQKYRPGARDAASGIVGGVIGNYIQSSEGRAYKAANDRIVDPFLRATTGAGYTETEIRNKLSGYSIQPGDDEATIRDKQKARRTFVESMVKSAGRGGEGLEMPGAPSGGAPKTYKVGDTKTIGGTTYIRTEQGWEPKK